MRAAVFIRYHSGDGFGHVGWAFEMNGLVNAGSVENHSGHIFTPATRMGFWNGCFEDPIAQMRERGYNDLKWIDVPNADPLLAYRTVLWIKHEAYKAIHRNCEDDAYDVLRAYGVDDLTWPSLMWFPKSWFKRFRGRLEHLREFEWRGGTPRLRSAPLACARGRSIPHDDKERGRSIPHDDEERGRSIPHDDKDGAVRWRPTWRRPWHPHFHALKLRRLTQVFRA